jgi:hypothetical protein
VGRQVPKAGEDMMAEYRLEEVLLYENLRDQLVCMDIVALGRYQERCKGGIGDYCGLVARPVHSSPWPFFGGQDLLGLMPQAKWYETEMGN